MMSALPLSEIVREIGASVKQGVVLNDMTIHSVCTDTRQIKTGDLFVALSGDNFDGNQFVAQAAEGGAVAAVVSQLQASDLPQLRVDDTQLALGRIAHANRRQFSGSVIALTGSAGKTTCKEMVASILAEKGEVLATKANLNNEIGVPLTLLQIAPEHEFAVVEMGAARAGDIAYLTQFAEPDISVLTNAMPVHIEGFGSLQTIANTKGEIFECLSEDGVAVINMDDAFASQWRDQAARAEIVSFSKTNSAADVFASNIMLTTSGSMTFSLHSHQGVIDISLQLLGQHNVTNALAAAAAALAAGAELAQVKTGLEKVQPVYGRLKAITLKHALLIDDSYNANPESVKAAIDVLKHCEGKRCLVLGTMGELGDMAESGHLEVAHYAREQGIEKMLAVGEFALAQLEAFAGKGKAYTKAEELLQDLNQFKGATAILVKGSRSARMERIVEALQHNNKHLGERE